MENGNLTAAGANLTAPTCYHSPRDCFPNAIPNPSFINNSAIVYSQDKGVHVQGVSTEHTRHWARQLRAPGCGQADSSLGLSWLEKLVAAPSCGSRWW